jgi:hypothetical protein
MVGDRTLQVLRGAEAEGAGVADIELDQAPALALQFAGAAGEFAADLVTDFGQALAGLEAGDGHRKKRGTGRARQPSGKRAGRRSVHGRAAG